MESTFSCCAYCWKHEESWEQLLYFKCQRCNKHVHYDCIKSLQPSPLLADTFFREPLCYGMCHVLIDVRTSDGGKEEFVRTSMFWHDVVMLALYNLHKTGQGRCGYFHYKAHIGAFIDQHWNTLFGFPRKKTSEWMGTLAGALSTGCPQYFLSGTHVGQKGHWRLAEIKPPTPHTQKKKPTQRKKTAEAPVELYPDQRRCRQSAESSLAAAVELKEKRSSLQRQVKTKAKKSGQKNVSLKEQSPSNNLFQTFPLELSEELYLSDSQFSIASSDLSLTTDGSYSSSLKSSVREDDMTAHFEKAGHFMMMGNSDDEDDLDIELVVTDKSLDPRPMSPGVDIMLTTDTEQLGFGISGKSPVSRHKNPPVEVKQEATASNEYGCFSEQNIHDELYSYNDDRQGKRTQQGSSEEEEGTEVEEMKREEEDASRSQAATSGTRQYSRPYKRRKPDDTPPPTPPQQLKRISLFEEGELLMKLNNTAARQPLPANLAQFRRKLICNQTNREFGLPVFDLENHMDKLAKLETTTSDMPQQTCLQYKPSRCADTKETRDLDRFMIHDKKKKIESRRYTSFHQRLVGIRDEELTPVVSPYTTRILLPFIWRNLNPSHKPPKMRLLEEITFDYCYIRPEHVYVNVCVFFWPQELSECLQYPDFSCVVMYRKIVIAFAFMVPDRGYNEAYISFIFTHPEWRGAGIATFMLYHLIQTCMGKDVLLHVSVTNPAMLLYQKFGFKCQELILNFYYKYFPLHCKESTHAFLMRLSR
ncbi:unnamed protein product [Candidula unifasciata]|uniref:N-acetyltransferase domain-containing protein n=1 Tax=Candidula unifasciata TaxID=100452 RepID=A0A8S3ZTI7_9EUPU|nr:unnamed protein product [Candidula unifasciata]